MCLNQGRPGIPSGLSQLRSGCIMPWLIWVASWGSIGPLASLVWSEALRVFPAASNASICFITSVRSRASAAFLDAGIGSVREVLFELVVVTAGVGSFDSARSFERAALRMAELFLVSRSFTNWRMLVAYVAKSKGRRSALARRSAVTPQSWVIRV